MSSEITLSPRELLYVAALLDAAEFLGVSDAFFGMEDDEIQQEMMSLQTSLEQKGYAEMDFDGGFSLRDDVAETVDVCVNCDTFVVVDKNKTGKPPVRELYYAKAGRIIMLKEIDGTSVLTQIPGTVALLGFVTQDIEWQAPPTITPLQNVLLSNALLAGIKQRPSDGLKILNENGCDELSAKAIIDGLSGNSSYYAMVITVFEGEQEGVYNAMLIDSPNGVYKMTPVTKEDKESVLFEPLTVQQAGMVMSNLINASFPQESEGFE